MHHHTIVIGAGLTGLVTAHTLRKKGIDVLVLEQQQRAGGQICTHEEDGFVFESGPNTGAISHPEVVELFQDLHAYGCELEEAHREAKYRWIWKEGEFRALPSSLLGAITTPLFSWKDKFRILGEPFRARGTNPDEPIDELVLRRLGRSYLDYAVDPFISGVYAGDPHLLVTRYALPKLYNLEQTYGSFIKGAIAKQREPKTAREKLATKQVFSAKGGLSRLVEALVKSVGEERLVLGASQIKIQPTAGRWAIGYQTADGTTETLTADNLITTVGGYALPALLPFVKEDLMKSIADLRYAPVVQVSVGVKNRRRNKLLAFGGLVPSCEQQNVLGILFPAACFDGRCPKEGELFSFFLGGLRHPEVLNYTDEAIRALVLEAFYRMLGFDATIVPDMIHIFRHAHAIPQYEISSGQRFAAIDKIEKTYPGLTLGGNIKGGIGMADRIKQGVDMALQIARK